MKNCKYIINSTNETYNSYTELFINWLDKLDVNKWQSLEDLVFSLNPIQDKINEQIKSVSKEYKISTEINPEISGIIDGEAMLKHPNSFYINEFLESDLCAVNGKRIVTQKNDEDYKQNFIQKLTKYMPKGKELTQEEAEKEFDRLLKGNKIIQEDAIMLHSLLTSSDIVSTKSSAINNFESKFYNAQTSRFEGNSLLADKLFNELRFNYLDHIVKPEVKILKNINLKSKLIGIDKDLIGHIDYITINPNGTLNLYNFKVSSQDYTAWPSAKVEKYKAQLVFLKYMLAENGINVENITLNIIPVKLNYNEDFSKVISIRVNTPISYSSNKRDASYNLENYDKLVSKFLKNNYTPEPINNDIIEKARENNKKIFPTLNIKRDGIGKTAMEWIKKAPECDPQEVEPLVIKEIQEPNHGYDIIIRQKNGTTKTIEIKSDKAKTKNKELIDEVTKYVEYLQDNKGYQLNVIKTAIREGYIKGKQEGVSVFAETKGLPSIFLDSIFDRYFEYTINENKEKVYKWKLLEDLSEANVLIFQKEDGQIEVVTLSSYDLNVSPVLKSGTSTVLGCHRYDTQTQVFKGDFGNIELIKTMTLLNELVPIFKGNLKLGKVQVINTQTQTQRSYSASYLNRQQFSEIVQVVNKENPNNKIQYNLGKCKYVDEIDLLLEEYLSVIQPMNESQKFEYTKLGFDNLQQIPKAQSEFALFNIMSNIYSIKSEFNKTENVLYAAEHGNNRDRNLARLLILASQAYQAVRGETVLHKSTLASIDTLSFTALTVPDINIRTVAENFQVTSDTIMSEFEEQFNPVNAVFEKFFDETGYSKLQSFTYGNEKQQFNNLFNLDNELFLFKNPYDESNNLTSAERELLKKVLFAMAKIRTHDNFQFESYNDPKLVEWIKDNDYYLWVPLARASKTSTRQSFKGIKSVIDYTKKLLTNSKERFENTMERLMSEESEMLDKGFEALSLTNPFLLSIPNSKNDITTVKNKRREMLKRGKDFYETNLKDLFINYLFKSISTDQYNKFLVSTKALLLSMHLTNNMGGNEEAFKREVEHIQDYLKVNVFQRSIMEPKSKKVISFINPIKKGVTNMFLMGNVISFFRDVFQGTYENTVRSLIKLNTNISPNALAKAYAYVIMKSNPNARAVNLLNKLCLRYRLSNVDVSKPAERAKSSRNGIFSGNFAYSTLRSPDFLNRMTLFVAKCMQDGCWDAWYIDENAGDLKYNWRNDKRFNLLATEDNSNPEEYAKQRALYFSKIREYNLEHPEKVDLELSLSTDLPTPYSNKEIVSIKGVADNISGSYDKSKKAMYENWALGVSLGMFTTWFNGIYNNYFSKPGRYATNMLEKVQDTDVETGQLLFFNTETNEITFEATRTDGTPNDIIWKNRPIITQGIFPTLATLYHVLKNDGKDALKDYLKANPAEKANMWKLLSDLFISTLFIVLFKVILDADWYNEKKKEMKENSIIQNLITEILYKSSSRSYDSFLGPINIIQQLGDNMNPPYYSAPIKVLKDTYSMILGEKQFIRFMTDNFGFARSFKDTYRAELRKNLE